MTNKRDKADEKRARNFVESFNELSLGRQKSHDANSTPAPRANDAERSTPRPSQRYPHPGGFVGGFPPLPSPPPVWPPHTPHAAMTPPPPVIYGMPIPQHTSLTMQHAMAGSLPATPTPPPPRPPAAQRPDVDHSNSGVGPRRKSDPPPPFVPPPNEGPRTPQPPKVKPPQTRPRAQSEPPSPISADGNGGEKRQCAGVTTAGKQCRNRVKPSGAQEHTDGDVFCRVHANKMGEPSGFYDRKTGQTFIKFSGERIRV